MRTTNVKIIFALALTLSPIRGFAADAKAGEAVYMKVCKTCHGMDGRGNAAIAKALNVTQPELASVSDEDVTNAVKNGRGKMKPASSVPEADLPDLIAFIRTLPKK